MKIKELMTEDAQVLSPESTIEQAAQAMADADVGSLPVVSRDGVVGVLTDRDIVVRVVAEGLRPDSTKAEQVMTADVVRCSPEDEAEAAAEVMAKNRIRRLIVVDDEGELAGVVSLADLAARVPGAAAKVLGEVSRPAEGSGRGVYAGGSARAGGADGAALELIKDELAAVESYKQALQIVRGGEAGDRLRRIETEHEEAAELLKERLIRLGIEAPLAADGGGAWSSARKKLAELVDEKTSISLLKEGEEREIEDYENALLDERLDSGLKTLIASSLLPQTRARVLILQGFLGEGPVA